MVKGAPEKIWELCIPDSIPSNYKEKIDSLTGLGYRVLGMAYKNVEEQKVNNSIINLRQTERDYFENSNNLTFLGLVVFEN